MPISMKRKLTEQEEFVRECRDDTISQDTFLINKRSDEITIRGRLWYVPTLDQIIEKMGECFSSLNNHTEKKADDPSNWICVYHIFDKDCDLFATKGQSARIACIRALKECLA